ncbi:type IX secretion system protein PorN/GldN [Fulvivirga ligni]|uniref:type IX secretion system ring protein PorN/GldN n=1 Tax=Fulvivirga ligni TaxID=2904246 RepID=UPI001F3A97D1|nr:gliding motility protein GldN [Fulvivirga ligni]UII22041.1 gliding motility protein GldN [Fulvivirga ligni]
MLNFKKYILIVLIGLLAVPAFAQLSELEQYNPNSIEPIARYEHLFKRRVWRTIDLQEKQNKGFFARGGEITGFILDAIKSGELVDLYTNDSLTSKMGKDEFMQRLVYQPGLEIAPWEAGVEYYEGDQVKYNGKVYSAIFDEVTSIPSDSPDDWEETPGVGDAILFLPRQITIMRLMEDMIFDKRRSRLYYKPQSIQLIIPGSYTLDGVELPLVVLKYKDLHKLFKDHPESAIWINRYNSAENKNFADAFELREFRSTLFKFENPDDDPIVDMYKNRMEAVMASEWWEMELMEKEHNLWEY